MTSKISIRWQTVIPKEIREELGVGPDWTLSWEVRDGVAVVVPIPPDPVRALYGILKGPGGSLVEDLLEERRRDRDREEAKERRAWERTDATKVRKRETG